MGRAAALLTVALLTGACGGNPPTSGARPASESRLTSPSTPNSKSLTGNYGLLIAAGHLQLVKPDAGVAASVAIASPSVQYCSSSNDGAMLAPPVSASNSQVYFRDGDTKVRMVVPPASAVDVTTVPGNATTVSFFSVSPDDRRIIVVVEDLSAATTIGLRLYVEDLRGGNHLDIYSTTQPKGKTGTTLWPMGWHQGALVLAVVTACTFEPAGLVPSEWHVSNATTADRMATIRGTNCTLGLWPSPAGVACVDMNGVAPEFDWTGKVVAVGGPGVQNFAYSEPGISPSGNSVFYSIRPGIGAPPPATRIVQGGPGPYATVDGHAACGWIDEDHLLAPDAVIQFPAETPGNVQVNTKITPLAQSGVCAGRFPGGL